jgi:hypothetical protein
MPAFAHEVEQATCEGVEIVFLAAPLKTVVGKDGKVNDGLHLHLGQAVSKAHGR